jgi:prolyl-tRNA synthetase
MKRTQLFIKTQKQAPADEVAKNAQLLIRAGFVYKVMAGVYAYTPLGIRVVEKIKQIVREEMNEIGGAELIMTALQRPDTWQTTKRWDDDVVDVWFKTKLKDGQDVGLAWSHEEAIIEMIKQHVASYKDLPQYVYQFQTKFRNELRSKSGIMRGREFVMKDMYSMSLDSEQHEDFYQKCIESYMKIFHRLGIGEDTFVTYASGGAFTKFSHEFQTICDAGEDTVYMNSDRSVVLNEEVVDEDTLKQMGINREDLTPVVTAEVGNIFNFGTQKSEEMEFVFTNKEGHKQYVHLGSYGIGITRVMGVLAEKLSDEKGLVWPMNVAPFHVYLATIGDVNNKSNELYEKLQSEGIEVLYDDRDERPGNKFADADLMGIPIRLVVSERTLEHNNVELKLRNSEETELVNLDDCISKIKDIIRQ